MDISDRVVRVGGILGSVIEIQNLTRRFGDVTAVDGLTLTVDEGEVFGLLGPNGAGKTTTVRMLTCLIGATSGQARVSGLSIADAGDAQKIRGMVGLLPEEAGLSADLTPRQTLDFFGRLYQVPPTRRVERIEYLLTTLGLWERRDAPVGTFSKGMRQRLAIARALVHDPAVLFLDEPTANLDPESAKTVREFLLEMRRDNRTILLNTHHLEEADRVCDRVGILNTRLVAVGRPAELRRSLWGHRTVVQLQDVTEPVVQAVRRFDPAHLDVQGNTITVAVGDPAGENPDLIAAIVAAGGRILFVTDLIPTLEDVYLTLVGGNG